MSSVTISITTCSSSAIRGTREDSTNAPPFSTTMREIHRTSGFSGLPWLENAGGLTGRRRTGVSENRVPRRPPLHMGWFQTGTINPGLLFLTLPTSRLTAHADQGRKVGPVNLEFSLAES